ncbi:hypothetical protein SAMN05421734_101153 [Pelagirhabdus alkalitolerans]|uniref:Carbohydrate deacetylase n=1 Tax=Pelagirhabdus alkalitolerans TaxID=1612202 RepID=A0A1G6GIV3_9BACI|nr:chitin disaccharide deacetylase [Pelagirhabdus alkalitolerans]SDB81941.1 hypothetical protein SAMN05421734_101153 [Pelagirhabdus alkalitolerans]
MKVIFNADDFGLTKGVTDGIIEAHEYGLVNATTVMMNAEATEYALEKAKDYPNLALGVHLVLTFGKPLSDECDSLVDSQGDFKFKRDETTLDETTLSQIEEEWRLQIDTFLEWGYPLDHLDSHHHVHGWPVLTNLIEKLAKDYDVPIRYVKSLKGKTDILYTDLLWLRFYKDGLEEDLFKELRKLKADSVEVMTHPGYVDDELKRLSSYTDDRKRELELLTSLERPTWATT